MAGSAVSQAQKDSADMNMTPMIDCVFQLIIFFMVVTEIKKSDDAEVQLPRTRFTERSAITPQNRVVISCLSAAAANGQVGAAGNGGFHDSIEIRNHRYAGPALEAQLAKLDRESRGAEGRAGAPVVGGAASGGVQSNLYVHIRADARCAWETVQQVQLACMKVGIYRLSYGTQPAQRSKTDGVGEE